MFDRWQSMDPHMLVSMLNMKLRDEAEDLTDLCRRYAIEQSQLEKQLAQWEYSYQPDSRQFRIST